MTVDVAAGRAAFLGALYEGCDGLLEFRAWVTGRNGAPPPVGREFCVLGDGAVVERFVTAHRNHDVYLAAATRRDATGGKLENCLHLGALRRRRFQGHARDRGAGAARPIRATAQRCRAQRRWPPRLLVPPRASRPA